MVEEIKRKNCAIYCRKSVDENLDNDFNSLDAQRESGKSYIASQKANGWVLVNKRYEDGGYSGGNMDRPALQELLKDCEAGLIDVIVIYKLDRLSRSICDFSVLSKKFDQWGVQFVSVTQDINTATSAGRMMLNILITFAQFEREQITDRIKDMVAASKKKGMWVGGNVPFGYVVENKRLIVKEDEKAVVQKIYDRYIEIQSPKLIAHELNEKGIKPKYGTKWTRGQVDHVLRNHVYLGEVLYHDEVYKGEQDAIITHATWDRVRTIMDANKRNHFRESIERESRMPNNIAPLRGIIRCGECNSAMSSSYSCKGKVRYHYYVCSKDTRLADHECPVRQIPADDIEELVRAHLKQLLSEPGMVSRFATECGLDTCRVIQAFQRDFWKEISPGEMNRLIQLLIEKIVVWKDHVDIEYKVGGLKPLIEELKNV